MLLRDACDEYVRHIKVERGLAGNTCSGYASWLHNFQNWLADQGEASPELPAVFTAPTLRRYLHALSARKYRPRTIRSVFAPIKGMAEYLVATGRLETNPVASITLPKRDAARRLTVSPQEVASLLDAVERQRNPRKVALHRAVLHVLVYCGLRAQEVVDLEVGHVSLSAGTLLVAHGKGDKSRLLYPPDECMSALRAWLRIREERCKSPYLFMLDVGRRIGYFSLCQILEDTKAAAGHPNAPNIKCHSLRHAFATRMMTNGSPLTAIQAALGHGEAHTTLIYLHHSEEDAKKMAQYAAIRPAEQPAQAPETASSPKPHTQSKEAFLRRRRATGK